MSPPTEDELKPTLNLTDPDGPLAEAPVVRLTAPDAAPVAFPELMETEPLTPFAPPFAETIETPPLADAELPPLLSCTLPPVTDADLPALAEMDPPDVAPSPARIWISPLASFSDLPDFMETSPEASSNASPV